MILSSNDRPAKTTNDDRKNYNTRKLLSNSELITNIFSKYYFFWEKRYIKVLFANIPSKLSNQKAWLRYPQKGCKAATIPRSYISYIHIVYKLSAYG